MIMNDKQKITKIPGMSVH